MQQQAPPVAFLFAAAAVAPIGFSVVVAALPAIGAAFTAKDGALFLIMSVFMLVFAVLQLVLGPLADRYGRRPSCWLGSQSSPRRASGAPLRPRWSPCSLPEPCRRPEAAWR
jgi:MFS family permease